MSKKEIKSVLIVDDDPLITDYISIVLSERDITPIVAANGQDGITQYFENKPDLALIDIRLPDINGFEVISKIRKKDTDTPLIVISGTGTIHDAIEAIRRGAWDFMIKPFQEASIIYHAIDKAFEKAKLIRENKRYQEHLEEQVEERTKEIKIANKELYEINERLKLIVESTNKMAAGSDIEELSHILLEEFARNMAAGGGSFYLYESNYLELVHALDPSQPLPKRIPFPMDNNSLLFKAISENHPVLIEDISKVKGLTASGWHGYKNGSLLIFPVSDNDGNLMAVISLHNKKSPPFKKQDIEIGKILGSYTYEALKAAKASEELRRSEARYRTIVEDQTELIVRYLPDGTRTFVNDSYCRFFDKDRSELLNTSFFPLIHKDELQDIQHKINSLSPENPVLTDEHRVLLPNGRISWQRWTDRIITDPQSDKIEYQAVGIDITERKVNEQALQDAMAEVERLKNKLEDENVYLREEIKLEHNFDEIIGKSVSIKKVFKSIEMVAPNDTTVLISGETGTGKELVARAIHNLSKRKNRPLVKVNCAALPPNLIESELFGHEKGSFTGAHSKRKGRFELADSGTIFLDEISEVPLDLQIKLLRVIQEGEFERVGGEETIPVDVRIIAATNRDLEKAIKENTFREDLYYRLNVIPIDLPPLRERKDDIEELAMHFAHKYGRKMGKKITSIAKSALDNLMALNWPGNIRELENVIERSVIFSREQVLTLAQPFLNHIIENGKTSSSDSSLQSVEREHILKILEKTHWVIEGESGAAKILDLHPNTLRSRMKKLQISKLKASHQ